MWVYRSDKLFQSMLWFLRNQEYGTETNWAVNARLSFLGLSCLFLFCPYLYVPVLPFFLAIYCSVLPCSILFFLPFLFLPGTGLLLVSKCLELLYSRHIMSLSLLPSSDHHKYRVAERKLYGVEGSSTFLECIPKSLQARVSWTFQKHPQNPREEVRGIVERGYN